MSFISIEDCGRGLECPIHYRVQDHMTDGVISLIDYVGEYAVHTNEMDLAEALWKARTGEEVFDFRVKVYHVGENGTLAEIAEDADLLMKSVIRNEGYYLPDEPDTITSDDDVEKWIFDQIMAAHLVTIDLVKSGIIHA